MRGEPYFRRLMAGLSKPKATRLGEDLTIIGELVATGRVTPVIGKRYSLGEVPEAIRYLEEGHARGKVVITLEN